MRMTGLASLLAALVVTVATPALAGEFGTADEARNMLEKVVAAVKADKAAALEMFTKGTGGFKDRDFYPFCGGPDGISTAHPTQVGAKLLELKDSTGKAFWVEMYRVAEEGKISEIDYMWPRPGETEPAAKVSFFTKVGDQVCGVGYYK